MSIAFQRFLPVRDPELAFRAPVLSEATTVDVARRLRAGAVLWDLRPIDDAQRAPIKGAVNLGQVDWIVEDRVSGTLQPASVISRILARAGIVPGRQVILFAGSRAGSLALARRALALIGVNDVELIEALPDEAARPAPAEARSEARDARPRHGATRRPADRSLARTSGLGGYTSGQAIAPVLCTPNA